MLNGLAQLLGPGQNQQQFQEFTQRYDQGARGKAFPTRNAQPVPAGRAAPAETYQRSAQQAFERLSPERHMQLGQYHQQQNVPFPPPGQCSIAPGRWLPGTNDGLDAPTAASDSGAAARWSPHENGGVSDEPQEIVLVLRGGPWDRASRFTSSSVWPPREDLRYPDAPGRQYPPPVLVTATRAARAARRRMRVGA